MEALVAGLPASFEPREWSCTMATALPAAARLAGLYDRVKTLGTSITDIIVLMGYYTAVSLTANFYDVVPHARPGPLRRSTP